jgi:predicted transcriptional regulator
MSKYSQYNFGPQPTRRPPPGEITSKVQALLLRILFDHGLSQGEVARRTKIQQTRVSRYAGGHVPRGAEDVFVLLELEQELKDEAARKAGQEPTPAPTAG